MTVWQILLYVGAAVLALRSFVQLVTNYRLEFEQVAVAEELKRLQEQVQTAAPEADGESSPAPSLARRP